MLEMKNICVYYNEHVVYNHAYFCAQDHELTVVIGKSGSGKSTLHELLTFQRTGTYEYYYNNENITDLNMNQQQEFILTHMGIVDQIPAFINDLKIKDHIGLCQSLSHGYDIDEIAEQLEIKHTYSLYPQQLSGGEKIRVSILLALIHQPEILVFDEPTASLDKHHTQLIVELLKDYAHQGHTVIIFTHDALIKKEADIVYQIENQKLTQYVINSPQIIEKKGISSIASPKHYTQYLYKMFEHRKLLKIIMVCLTSLSIGLCSFSVLYGQSVIQKYIDQLALLDKGGVFYREYIQLTPIPPSIGEEIKSVKKLSHVKTWPFILDEYLTEHLDENLDDLNLKLYQDGQIEDRREMTLGTFGWATYNENFQYKMDYVEKTIDNEEGIYISLPLLYYLKTGNLFEDRTLIGEETLKNICQEVNENTEIEFPVTIPVYRTIENEMEEIHYQTIILKMKIKGIVDSTYPLKMAPINNMNVDLFCPLGVIEKYQTTLMHSIPEDAQPYYPNYYQFVVEDGYDFNEAKEDIEAQGFKVSSDYYDIYTKVDVVKQLNESIFMISGLIMFVVLMLFFGVKYNQRQDDVDFIHFFTRCGFTVSFAKKILGIYFLYESFICMVLSIVFMFVIAYVFFALMYNEVFIIRPSFFVFCIVLSLCIEVGIPMIVLGRVKR